MDFIHVTRAGEGSVLRLAVTLVGWLVSDDTGSYSWVLWQRFFVHAEMCKRWMETTNWHWWDCGDAGVLHTVACLGVLDIYYNPSSDVVAMLRRALRGCEKTLTLSHPLTLFMVIRLGWAYRLLGRLDEAETVCQRALQDCRKVLGPENQWTLGAMQEVCVVHMNQGRLEKARNMLQQLLDSRERVLGPSHVETVDTLVSLATVYNSQGQLDKSEAMLQQALERIEEGKGVPRNLELSSIACNRLGDMYALQGRLEEAEQMYGKALSGYQTIVGPSHPWSQDAMRNLEKLRQTKGNVKTESSSALSPIPSDTKGAS